MIPVGFEYERAETAEHALELLAEHGDDAKLLAGGHSLLPLMKLRLAAPAVVIDIARIEGLSYIRVDGAWLAIGALTRHRDLEISPLVLEHAPLLARAASQVGDPQVRHRGTIGGSLVHGDPASDLAAVVIALGGELVIRGRREQRTLGVDEFFTGFLETAVGADELLTEIRVPCVGGTAWSFQKFNRRAQEWAIVGVAAVALNGGAGIGLVNMGATPLRATASERAVASGAGAVEAASLAADGAAPPSDVQASEEFRRHLAGVLTRRALQECGLE